MLGHIPKAYLEGYLDTESKAKKIRYKAKTIFTANTHLDNDFFKVCLDWDLDLFIFCLHIIFSTIEIDIIYDKESCIYSFDRS